MKAVRMSGRVQQSVAPQRLRRAAAWSVALGVALGGLVACGSDGDDDGDDSRRDARPLAEEFSVVGALKELPVTGVELDGAVISVADLDAASAAGGVERPADDSRDAWIDWVGPITGIEPNPVFVPLANGFNHQAGAPEEFAEVAGWSMNDVASFAEIAAPPYQFTVVTGLDDGALADSLVDSGDGIRSSGDGEDFENDLTNVSAVDRLGRSIRFLQRDDMVGFGTSTPMVTAWASDGESVADDTSFVDVAAALDDEDVVSAVLTRAPKGGLQGAVGQNLTPEQLATLEEELEAQIAEEPFDVVGIGWDEEGEVHVAYHFADADAANAGVDVLEKAWRDGTSVATRQPLSEFVTVDDSDVEGSVAVVTVIPVDERAARPWQMLQQREIVFVAP